MKKLTILLVTAITLFNLACRPDKCCVLPNHNLYLTALKNGAEWAAGTNSSNIKGDTVTVDAWYSTANRQEHLVMQFKYASNSKYLLTGGQVIYNYSIGTQAPLHPYALDNTFENYVIVNSYDSGTELMTGTFNLKLVKTPADPYVDPAEVSFLNGKFEVRLQK